MGLLMFSVDNSHQLSIILTMAEDTRKQINVRFETAAKLESFAKSRRLKVAEVVDIAIDALNSLPEKKQNEIIAQGSEPVNA